MRKSQRLSLSNSQSTTLNIVIEPWATEINLSPGSILDVMISYKYDGYPYVSLHDELVEIYLWSGCTCRLLIDNVEVADPGLQLPHP